ncbi:unnamed protein product [Caenorhabditis brenneri]
MQIHGSGLQEPIEEGVPLYCVHQSTQYGQLRQDDQVFQGGVSPADLRVISITFKAIKTGDELTFNYGDEYVGQHLGTCLCDKCKEERGSRKRKKAYQSTVYINPLEMGNFARMTNHSCDPNM